MCDFKGTARCFKRSSALKRNPELRENYATTKTLVEVQLPGGKMVFFYPYLNFLILCMRFLVNTQINVNSDNVSK